MTKRPTRVLKLRDDTYRVEYQVSTGLKDIPGPWVRYEGLEPTKGLITAVEAAAWLATADTSDGDVVWHSKELERL